MLHKALVLDGNAGMDEVFRDVLIFDPRPVRTAVELLQHNILPRLRVLIIDDRRLVEREALERKIVLRREVIFDIQRKQTCEHQHRQHADEHDRPDHASKDAPSVSLGFISTALGGFVLICHTVPP